MINKKTKINKGFTLIETFVAITVLMIAVLGPMSLLSNALRNSRHIADDIIANSLAQEGVELMIGLRNAGGDIKTVPPSYNCTLKWDVEQGYQCEVGVLTIFRRSITSEKLSGPGNQFKIISTVERTNYPSQSAVSGSIIFKKG